MKNNSETVSCSKKQQTKPAAATSGARFRAGDLVEHVPSGESWFLALDQIGDQIIPTGHVEFAVLASDCRIVFAASEEQRTDMLRTEIANPNGPRSRIAVMQMGEHMLEKAQKTIKKPLINKWEAVLTAAILLNLASAIWRIAQ